MTKVSDIIKKMQIFKTDDGYAALYRGILIEGGTRNEVENKMIEEVRKGKARLRLFEIALESSECAFLYFNNPISLN